MVLAEVLCVHMRVNERVGVWVGMRKARIGEHMEREESVHGKAALLTLMKFQLRDLSGRLPVMKLFLLGPHTACCA